MPWPEAIVIQRKPQDGGTPTSRGERVMLAMAIIALPAENHFLFLPGFSILFVLFGAIALYVTLARFSHLLRILFHPVFLAGYAFLGFDSNGLSSNA